MPHNIKAENKSFIWFTQLQPKLMEKEEKFWSIATRVIQKMAIFKRLDFPSENDVFLNKKSITNKQLNLANQNLKKIICKWNLPCMLYRSGTCFYNLGEYKTFHI